MEELDDATFDIGVVELPAEGITASDLTAAVADRAPNNAKYIVQEASAGLSAEQSLGALSTGIVKVTVADGVGVLSTASGSDLPAHNHAGVVYDRQLVIDGGGAEIATGIKGDFRIPVASTITEWNLFADQTGSIQIDLWRADYSGWDSISNSDSITSDQPLTITAGKKNAVATTGISNWSKSLAAGDIIRVNVDSVTDIQRVTLVLWLTRSI